MRKIICDICGNEINDYPAAFKLSIVQNNPFKNDMDNEYNVCPECGKKIRRMIASGGLKL